MCPVAAESKNSKPSSKKKINKKINSNLETVFEEDSNKNSQKFKASSDLNEAGLENNNEISEDFTVWNSNIESEYKDRGQAYLINFTAAWCITCQANDKIALSRPNIKDYLKNNNIEYIVADWTNKNDEILSALEKYERNGVPLYIYWKPGMESSETVSYTHLTLPTNREV